MLLTFLLKFRPPGGRWERALEVFELLRSRGCKPDGGVFGSLLGALAAGGQWQRSLQAFARLQVRTSPLFCSRCRPSVPLLTPSVHACSLGTLLRRRPCTPRCLQSALSPVPAAWPLAACEPCTLRRRCSCRVWAGLRAGGGGAAAAQAPCIRPAATAKSSASS
jgi:hypothetical protein